MMTPSSPLSSSSLNRLPYLCRLLTFGMLVMTLMLVWVSVSFAEDATQDSAFLILPSGVVASQTMTQTPAAVVTQYVQNQLALHGLTPEAYLSLDASLQRQVMTPGRSMVLSREQTRQIVPKRIALPTQVMQSLVLGSQVDTQTIGRFGVGIPTMHAIKTSQGMTLTPILFGNTLVMINHEGRIMGVTHGMF
jgi:hypothetical protein